MANRKGKLPPIKNDSLAMRSVQVQNETADGIKRSVRVVTATENPVERYDEHRGEVVKEVLAMDGLTMRPGATQIPIVDSHDTSTVRNVLGSLRGLGIAGDEFGGVAFFASDAESQSAYQKLLDGHVTDFSITALPNETLQLRSGQTYTTSRGTVVDGPANVITSWTPLDASLVATGADSRSTIRRSYLDLKPRTRAMDEALLSQLSAMGLPDGMTDPNQVLSWVVGKLSGGEEASAEPVESAAEEVPAEEVAAPAEEEKPIENMEGTEEEKPTEEVRKLRAKEAEKAIKRALANDQKRRSEIQAAVKIAKLERAFADELCDSGVSVADANSRIIQRMATQPLGTTVGGEVRVTESADDKFYNAMRDGLIARTFRMAGVRRQAFDSSTPAPGFEDFANMKLSRMAEAHVDRLGCNVNRMAPKDIALVAMGQPAACNRYRVQREAYHTTGSFPNLLLDAANKTLLAGYEEAPYTWEMWARNAGTTSDFKAINRIRFSEMATPEMVPENKSYPEAAMSDAKETYRIHKYGSVFTITWETVVNDDLDAISRIPAMQGAACRRKQNQAVYAVITDNAAMADTGLLFNSTAQTTAGGHANLAGSTGAPSVTTLNAGFVSMLTKKGLRSDVILNIQPSFLIVPAALSATALQLVGSIADPSSGGSNAGNSNTKNIYGPNGDRPLKVVVEPVLDGNSSTAWYLAASNNQVDTVEVTFLEGEQSPVLESEWDFDKDVYKYKVRQTFGVAPIDYRGLYKNAG